MLFSVIALGVESCCNVGWLWGRTHSEGKSHKLKGWPLGIGRSLSLWNVPCWMWSTSFPVPNVLLVSCYGLLFPVIFFRRWRVSSLLFFSWLPPWRNLLTGMWGEHDGSVRTNTIDTLVKCNFLNRLTAIHQNPHAFQKCFCEFGYFKLKKNKMYFYWKFCNFCNFTSISTFFLTFYRQRINENNEGNWWNLEAR